MTTVTKQTFYETYPDFDWKFYVQYNDFKHKIKNETPAYIYIFIIYVYIYNIINISCIYTLILVYWIL